MRAALSLLVLVLPGCLSPPVLHWYDQFPADFGAAGYPQPYELVELEVETGTQLRGVFVCAGEGAPVVLHLLGSGSSAVGTYHYREGVLRAPPVIHSLLAEGISSLIVDYRGVGASDGERSAEHFADDVERMYAEALARAGHPSRVFLRAISIGTLPTGLLLDSGETPAGIVLVAPVRNETVVEHFAYRNYAAPLAFIGLLWYQQPVELETERVFGSTHVPLWVVTPHEDHFLPAQERDFLRAVVVAAGHAWTVRGAHHEDLSLEARDLLPGELEFLRGIRGSE